MQSLECSDNHGHDVGHSDSAGSDTIVGVHESMDSIIHDHKPSAGGGEANIRIPGEPENSNMMIPVKKDQFLFSQNNEHSINQFW